MLPLTPEEKQLSLRLVRQALTVFLSGEALPDFRTEHAGLLQPRASFVTLRRRDTDELRGCRGEVRPRRPLVESLVRQTIASATDDPRFDPVTLPEVEHLGIHLSALTPLARIDVEEIVLGRHGLMIVRGRRSGLLLPQVPTLFGMVDREEFLDALCRKAGLPSGAWSHPKVALYGFEAEVWGEEGDLGREA
jgi:AmmeMemoRadiSam system protein A